MANFFPILMGDISSSSDYEQEKLRVQLKQLIEETNTMEKDHILSPLTITLGDEFQGVAHSEAAGMRLIFSLEERILQQRLPFRLHYVLLTGEIETRINKRIAYEMMGSGLTKAREMLSSKKRDRKRFEIKLHEGANEQPVQNMFQVLDSISSNWKQDDYPIIHAMLQTANNTEVANAFSKNRSQIWKRRKTLMIEEYQLLKSSILTLV
ncbi:MAG: SatD family protein [Bacteroidota bacterium]